MTSFQINQVDVAAKSVAKGPTSVNCFCSLREQYAKLFTVCDERCWIRVVLAGYKAQVSLDVIITPA